MSHPNKLSDKERSPGYETFVFKGKRAAANTTFGESPNSMISQMNVLLVTNQTRKFLGLDPAVHFKLLLGNDTLFENSLKIIFGSTL